MRILVALILLSVAPAAWTYDPDDPIWQEVKSNLASDWALCAAYYSVAAQGFENAENHDGAAGLQSLANNALQMAAALSNEKRALAEVELGQKVMLTQVDYDLANFAVLSNEYLLPCKALHDNPQERIQHWFDHFTAPLE